MILASFTFLLLAAAVNPAQSQDINISGNDVFMTCPEGEDGLVTWSKDGSEIEKTGNQIFEVKDQQGPRTVEGLFSCEYKKPGVEKITKHMFYLNVKVCDNCYELSGLMAWGTILGDVLVTGGVILIVYIFATKNSGGTQQRASNSRSLNPPRPPNPDYEALDPKMRSNAVYAGLNK
ncbi:T-cell surface glycoprotein CD3 epsilon chain-like [Labeo rohita]|uniref:T-cell surface glycoprotein CD3 epsilon chain-like n=1 Tax=Labeo rohita TaxID=84645 RepID=UPI0021E1D6CF|nr:T-cell surface glycoprotein CD3 epsilon chain-like [Labeo rohita]